MYKLGLASKQKARVTLARISRYFVIVVKFQYRIPFQLDQEKCSLQKQAVLLRSRPEWRLAWRTSAIHRRKYHICPRAFFLRDAVRETEKYANAKQKNMQMFVIIILGVSMWKWVLASELEGNTDNTRNLK